MMRALGHQGGGFAAEAPLGRGGGGALLSTAGAEPGSILRVTNLPSKGTFTRDTVCEWFNADPELGMEMPLTRDRVELLVHCSRKPRAGNHAYVQFLSAADAQRAMAKHGQKMGNTLVSIEVAGDRSSVRGLPGHLIFLRGLSFDTTPEEVAEWFADVPALSTPVASCDVAMADVASMESSGLAWVSFPSAEEAAAASAKHKDVMGARYIEILPATTKGNAENSSMLALRGLPFTATSQDICDWFNDDATLGISPITPDRISHTPLRSCPLGCAFVSLSTSDEGFDAAAAKHKQNLGQRYIEVYVESVLGSKLRTFLPAR